MAALVVFMRMVKIEHSIFALPFAYIGAFLAAGGWPGWRVFLPLTVAMVAVRSFAMAYNRLVDLPFDRQNPRTKDRPLVTGEISPKAVKLVCLGCALIFFAACAALNDLCLTLAGPALLLSGLYSFTKRFTWLCHFVLGAVLGLAPLAGWIAVDPVFTPGAVLFALGVLFWVAGFDILYSCQDIAFDQGLGLHSVPVRFGLETALTLSSFCHVNTGLFFLLGGWAAGAGLEYFPVWAVVTAILVWEHRLISPQDMSRVNLSFFTLNGVVAVFLFGGVLASQYLALH